MHAARPPQPDLAPDPLLPNETRLWAALQELSGGTWGGCVFDVERILRVLEAGRGANNRRGEPEVQCVRGAGKAVARGLGGRLETPWLPPQGMAKTPQAP